MDSKMRPLWLVFHNQDMLGESILHIFKNGDGMMGCVCVCLQLTTWNILQTCDKIC